MLDMTAGRVNPFGTVPQVRGGIVAFHTIVYIQRECRSRSRDARRTHYCKAHVGFGASYREVGAWAETEEGARSLAIAGAWAANAAHKAAEGGDSDE